MRASELLRQAAARLTLWRAVFLGLMAAGLYAAVVRFAQGLGAATNLSDSFPWGLWIGFDVLVGVGLAAGGFVIAATVHVFRLERYAAIARPTVLTAFLGYLLVIVALLFDLGRPYRIWHPLVMWNPHSVMFEVAWCVMLYTAVLALEFRPLLLERLGLHRALRAVRGAFLPLVVAGVLLSTLHQSSLGTLYVIAPDKLHGLWYTPLLPLFFFLTAIAGGLAMTIVESFLSHRAFGRRIEAPVLERLGRVIVVVLGLATAWRLEDLIARGNAGLLFELTPESVLFAGEMVLGALLPMALFAVPRLRRSEPWLFFAAMLTVLGFIVNRLNVAVTGMAASSGVSYVPSVLEFVVTIAIVAAGFALFALAVRYLPVFPEDPEAAPSAPAPARRPVPAFTRSALLALWVLLVVGGIAVAAASFHRGSDAAGAGASSPPVAAPRAPLDLPPPFTFPTADASPGAVTFRHETHVDPARPDCATCHASLFRITQAGRPHEGPATYERIHEGDLCASCHDGESAAAIDEDCAHCHAP